MLLLVLLLFVSVIVIIRFVCSWLLVLFIITFTPRLRQTFFWDFKDTVYPFVESDSLFLEWCVCVVVSNLAILRREGCLNSTPLKVCLESPTLGMQASWMPCQPDGTACSCALLEHVCRQMSGLHLRLSHKTAPLAIGFAGTAHLRRTARQKDNVFIVAIFYPFSQFCEIFIFLLSLQKQPKTVPNLFQRGVDFGKYGLVWICSRAVTNTV